MKIIKGNILDVKSGTICHQVNCQGAMGSGLALQIRNKWPQTYHDYRRAYHREALFLGNVITSTVGPDLYVAHLCGQDRYGRKSGRVYTDYVALAKCMRLVAAVDSPVYIPYNMGCGLAGGDWGLVIGMIDAILPNAIVVKLG